MQRRASPFLTFLLAEVQLRKKRLQAFSCALFKAYPHADADSETIALSHPSRLLFLDTRSRLRVARESESTTHVWHYFQLLGVLDFLFRNASFCSRRRGRWLLVNIARLEPFRQELPWRDGREENKVASDADHCHIIPCARLLLCCTAG